MKIIIEEREENDYGEGGRYKTTIETAQGKCSASFGSGEPEDMTLGRDLNDAYSIPKMLKMAYEAGRAGEELEEIEKEFDW